MNKLAMISLAAVGGTALFAVSFLGFAKVNGVPMHTLPLVGGMFPPAPEDPEHSDASGETSALAVDEHANAPHSGSQPASGEASTAAPAGLGAHDETGAASSPAGTALVPPPAREMRSGIFDVIDTDGLYTQDELRALADSLRARHREVDQRASELDRREDLLSDRLTALDERRRTMDEFAARLDARERELKAREAEANRDESIGGAKDGKKVPAGELAEFFSEGETEVLVQRLSGFTAQETAQILIKLAPARAKELLDALPSARWRECAEAYARAAQTPPP